MELGILLLNPALPPFKCHLSGRRPLCLAAVLPNVYALKTESCVDIWQNKDMTSMNKIEVCVGIIG